jgi:hypothetical protein
LTQVLLDLPPSSAQGLNLFPEKTLISRVKGKSFSVKILQGADVYIQDRTTKIQFS